MDLPLTKPPARALTIAIVTPRRDRYQAAADCLRTSANLSWVERLDRGRIWDSEAVLFFADDFDALESHSAIERGLKQEIRCMIVVARHLRDYESFASVARESTRLTILPLTVWEVAVLRTIRASVDSSV
jgi:hypothetical protein